MMAEEPLKPASTSSDEGKDVAPPSPPPNVRGVFFISGGGGVRHSDALKDIDRLKRDILTIREWQNPGSVLADKPSLYNFLQHPEYHFRMVSLGIRGSMDKPSLEIGVVVDHFYRQRLERIPFYLTVMDRLKLNSDILRFTGIEPFCAGLDRSLCTLPVRFSGGSRTFAFLEIGYRLEVSQWMHFVAGIGITPNNNDAHYGFLKLRLFLGDHFFLSSGVRAYWMRDYGMYPPFAEGHERNSTARIWEAGLGIRI